MIEYIRESFTEFNIVRIILLFLLATVILALIVGAKDSVGFFKYRFKKNSRCINDSSPNFYKHFFALSKDYIATYGYGMYTYVNFEPQFGYNEKTALPPRYDYLLFMKKCGIAVTALNFVGNLSFNEKNKCLVATNPDGTNLNLIDNIKRPLEYESHIANSLTKHHHLYKYADNSENVDVAHIIYLPGLNPTMEQPYTTYDQSFEKYIKKNGLKENTYIVGSELEIMQIIKKRTEESQKQNIIGNKENIIAFFNSTTNESRMIGV